MTEGVSSYCYFTPASLADRLLDLIPVDNIQTAIDISCGKGALLRAVKERNKNINLTGVDILNDFFSKDYFYYCEDGIEFAEKCTKKYDLVLSNPPFGKTGNRLLGKDKGIIKGLHRKRLECLMLNANFSLMHKDSWMIVILPATMILGSSFHHVREDISQRYYVKDIVSLPDDTFGTDFIRTFALVLYGSPRTNETSVYIANHDGDEWDLQQHSSLTCMSMHKGDWWNKTGEISNRGIQIIRGNICSSDFDDSGVVPVWHCAAKGKSRWEPSIRYVKSLTEKQSQKRAEVGDVIINRIGKSAGYWWINNQQSRAITDCLLVVKGLKNEAQVLMDCSSSGRLNIPTRGVATQYITSDDVLRILVKNKGNEDFQRGRINEDP